MTHYPHEAIGDLLARIRCGEDEATARRAGWKTADLTPGMLVNESRIVNGLCAFAFSWAEACTQEESK